MSQTGGIGNPVYTNEDESYKYSVLKNSLKNGQEHILLESDATKPEDLKICFKDGHVQSFVSQHCIQTIQSCSESCYKTENRIELETNNLNESPTLSTEPNGIHANGNNNDVNFLNSSINSTGINSEANKKEQIEAVNLELISMKPYTGTNALQLKSQEACEIATDPYEEYLVPVNEHRKYIRGEKLYVTKDKRSRSSYRRKLFCWSCGFLVLFVAVIMAILVATGFLLPQSTSQLLEDDHTTNSRQLGEIHTGSIQLYAKNLPPSPPPHTSSFPQWLTTSEALYQTVQNAVSGIIRINNFEWSELMTDPTSTVFKDVAREIENNLKQIIRLKDNLSVIKVYEIRENAEVRFRISRPLLSTPESIQKHAKKKLRQNGNRVGKFTLGDILMNSLKDECQIENGGCIEICKYDYLLGIFVCICSKGKKLDKTGKVCLPDNNFSNLEMFEPSVIDKKSNSDSIQNKSSHSDKTFLIWKHEYPAYGTAFKSTDDLISYSKASVIIQSENDFTRKLKLNFEPTIKPKSESEYNLTKIPISESFSTAAPIAERGSNSQLSAGHTSSLESTSEANLQLEYTTEKISAVESAIKNKFDLSSQSNLNRIFVNKSNFYLVPYTELQSETKPTNQFNIASKLHTESKSLLMKHIDPKSITELLTKSETFIEPKSEYKSDPVPCVKSKTKIEPSLEFISKINPLVNTKFSLTEVNASEIIGESSTNSLFDWTFRNVKPNVQKIGVNFDKQTKFLIPGKSRNIFSHSILTHQFANNQNTTRVIAERTTEEILKSNIMTNAHMKHESKPKSDSETVDSINKAKNASDEVNDAPEVKNDFNIRENSPTTMYPKITQNIGADIEPFLDVIENNKKTEENTKFGENDPTESHTIIQNSDSKIIYQSQKEEIMQNNNSENFAIASRNKIAGNKDDHNLSNRTEIHAKHSIIYQVANMTLAKNFELNENSTANVSNSMNITNISGQELNENKKLNTEISNSDFLTL